MTDLGIWWDIIAIAVAILLAPFGFLWAIHDGMKRLEDEERGKRKPSRWPWENQH